MLKVEHVTFRYERRGAPVLRDASLSLETGQVGVLLGRNGCGKTTLLKTTLGLCTPEQGQILASDCDTNCFAGQRIYADLCTSPRAESNRAGGQL